MVVVRRISMCSRPRFTTMSCRTDRSPLIMLLDDGTVDMHRSRSGGHEHRAKVDSEKYRMVAPALEHDRQRLIENSL